MQILLIFNKIFMKKKKNRIEIKIIVLHFFITPHYSKKMQKTFKKMMERA